MLVECVGEEWKDRVLAISRRAEVYWEDEVVVRWGTGGKKVMPGGEQWGRWCKEGQWDKGAEGGQDAGGVCGGGVEGQGACHQ